MGNSFPYKKHLFSDLTFWALINVNSLPMVYDIVGDVRIGALTGLFYFSSNLAVVAGPQMVRILIDLTEENYKIMFVFAAFFMALAGLLMYFVKDGIRTTNSRK